MEVFCAILGLMKTPHCKICNQDGHYAYACWRNPKRGYNLKKKYEKAYKTGKTPKRDKTLSSQSLDRKRLIMELDKYCSLIVRLQASDKYGAGYCYTCGKKIPWKQAHCCHYISRRYMGTRFDFDNLRFGCSYCNVTLRGNLEAYKNHLLRDIGVEGMKKLEEKKMKKISTPELEELLK